MTSSTTEISERAQQQTRRSLYLGITVWFLHQNTVNALTSVSCKWDFLSFSVAGMPGVQFVDMIISIIALAAMAYLVYTPWRIWRRVQTKSPQRDPRMLADTEEDRGAMTAFVTMGLNSFLLLFILATFVPIFALRACGQV